MPVWKRQEIQTLLRQIMKTRSDLDYIIVLGAHVNGTKLTLALLERVRRALLYLEENPGTKAVLSGGRGDGRRISEAELSCRYLTDDHSPERLIKERTVKQYKRKSGFQSASDRQYGLQHWTVTK